MKSQEKRDEQAVEITRALLMFTIPMVAFAVGAETVGLDIALLVGTLIAVSALLIKGRRQ